MSSKGAKLRRLEQRRKMFREGLSVREYSRALKQEETHHDPDYFGCTWNRRTMARNDGSGTWGRGAWRVAA